MGIEELKGKTLLCVSVSEYKDKIEFITTNGRKYRMLHHQDCCENVSVEDICGNLSDLIGSPILMAEESTNEGEEEYGTFTWTFYKLGTVRGVVTIRWYGSSNGYYSERVDFEEVT